VVQAIGAATTNFLAAAAQQTVSIFKATPAVKFAPAPTPTYLGGNFTVSASTTNTDSGVLTYSYVSGPCAWVSGATFSSLGAGPCVVQAIGATTSNFLAAAAQQTVSIGKATATVQLNNMTQTYTGSPLAPTATTNPSNLGINWTNAPQTNAGSYSVTATVNDPNYQGSTGGTFTINQASATVTLSNMTQTYTGLALAPTATTLPANLKMTWWGAPQTNAGSYSFTCTVSDPNYSGSKSGTFVIQPATATVTLSNMTQTYTGSALSPTANTVPSGLSVAWTGAPDTKAGPYPVTAKVSNPNYSSNTASGNFVIQPATPVINWPTPAPITYGTALSAAQSDATATSSGVAVNGTYAYTPPAGTVLNAGTETLNVTFIPSDGADYKRASGSVTLTVNKATPVVTWANPAAITYGTVLGPKQLDATASVPGTFAYTPKAGTVLGVGVQTLSVLFTPGPSGPPGPPNSGNYTTATKTVSITVNPAVLTVTATNISAKHNQPIPPLTYTVTGFVNGNDKSVLSGSPNESTTGKQGSAAGKYPITITQGTLSAANYTFTFVNGTLTITP
jgi:hypothetical protein